MGSINKSKLLAAGRGESYKSASTKDIRLIRFLNVVCWFLLMLILKIRFSCDEITNLIEFRVSLVACVYRFQPTLLFFIGGLHRDYGRFLRSLDKRQPFTTPSVSRRIHPSWQEGKLGFWKIGFVIEV